MRKVQDTKYLLIGISAAALLLAGCHSSDKGSSSTYYQSSYSPGMTSSDVATSTDTQHHAATGATGSQTYQATGGEIQSERMVIPLHEEQVVVGKRTVETGTVRLRKEITTETINQPVQIRKETIVVDRQGAGGTSTNQSFESSSRQGQQLQSQAGSISQPFEQGEIVVRLHSEEPVIEKRVVPAGNVVVETRVNSEQMNVQQQVRRENVHVDKGNAQNVTVSENLGTSGTREAAGAPASEPQRIQPSTTPDVDTEYRAPVTTREYEPFPRPQPDGHETFPALNKDPQRDR